MLLINCRAYMTSVQANNKSSAVLLSEITRLVQPSTRIISDTLLAGSRDENYWTSTNALHWIDHTLFGSVLQASQVHSQ